MNKMKYDEIFLTHHVMLCGLYIFKSIKCTKLLEIAYWHLLNNPIIAIETVTMIPYFSTFRHGTHALKCQGPLMWPKLSADLKRKIDSKNKAVILATPSPPGMFV